MMPNYKKKKSNHPNLLKNKKCIQTEKNKNTKESKRKRKRKQKKEEEQCIG